MIPRTVSASALQVADLCLARYKAENIEYTPTDESEKVAANVGTSCHYALEKYVEIVYMKKAMEPSLELLLQFFHVGYLETFDTVEFDTPEYKDGVAMLKKWYARTDLSDVTVVSVETKTRFPMETSVGFIPLTYIWDRCDIFIDPATGKKVCRVVDYKSIRAQLGHEEVRGKLQARIYDVMARIQFRDQGIEEFQVVFDLLRHEPVGVIFSREEAEATWNGVLARIERIIATPDDKAPETLNAECPYCVRKMACNTLRRNIAGGGVFSIGNIDTAVARRYELGSQLAGIKAALDELDSYILKHAEMENELTFDVDALHVAISASRRRTVDATIAADVLGPELMARYGKLNVGDIDKLIEEGNLTAEQVTELRRSITFSLSAPSVKITPKKK